jgi:hypothetical protein
MKKISLKDKVEYLEKKWQRRVRYSCLHCLDVAFVAVVENINGYVTDEELIESSGDTLKHK